MKCPDCGNSNPPHARECEYCGYEFAGAAPDAGRKTRLDAAAAPPSGRRRTVFEPGRAAKPAPRRAGTFTSDPFLDPPPARPAYDPQDPFRTAMSPPPVPEPADAPPPPPPAAKPSRKATMIDGGPTRPAGSPAGVLLAYTSPDDKGTAHVLRAGRNVLGRDDAADITLADGRISGQHAFVFVRDGSTSFIDVSTNGSVVDGRPVIGQEVVLEDGSVLRLGGMVLVYTRLRTPPEGAWA